mmetsp:Transcript_11476/g.25170  ORF Transcript_11476/g.25170 Transcript_11476/m.25170 type:complete len:356 (-) Transcript_11476:231-1298(-)|eukprot:CAMPEP_0113299126 /NCGR_PEP_ID=MMETSP0010_2-20120614/1289_1 /TAXON_ID=216773 ORGANISM="Corethron hystrix, Strain 308" /NCGR_SAMPLE_ID=MMETSP0010_2 /ASSEMBLY_ACC=CAM_ASM_000155 /LENGTH=355 /DNA_ID=CAMNT_0000152305 /DNA_START=103 /DNA_END=1170 /DNA_ORIENTATION=- /assembly_acc=CAM_ASM_000155
MRISTFDMLNQRSAVEGVRNRTLSGGIITVIASSVAAILFLAELYMYIQGDVVHHLTVDARAKAKIPSSRNQSQMSPKARARLKNMGKIKVAVKVTFPHLDCGFLEVVYEGNGGWAYNSEDRENIHELKSRLVKSTPTAKDAKEAGMGTVGNQGCTIKGSLYVEKVAGSFGIQLGKLVWRSVSDLLLIDNLSSIVDELGPDNRKRKHIVDVKHNSSNYIHYMNFGNNFPHTPNPMKGVRTVYDDNDIPLGLSVFYVKLIPTRYKKSLSPARDTVQVSMAEHIVHGPVLAMSKSAQTPGLSVSYDFSPLEVHHTEQREGILSFIASLMSIVGGVYVTVGLVSRFLVGAVQAAKKHD